MYRLRVYRTPGEVVVAACDADVVGRRLTLGKAVVDVSEAFYGDRSVNEPVVVAALQDCTVANLIGPRVVALALRLGLVRADRVLNIEGVPHAQVARIP